MDVEAIKDLAKAQQADLVLKYYTEKLSSASEKQPKKEQASGQQSGKGQQKQKNNAQTANGKGGKHTNSSANGTNANPVDTTSGATKKGK